MSRKHSGLRDTAKDIILNLTPSGAGPREPRGSVALRSEKPKSKKETPANAIRQIIFSRPDSSVIIKLQNQLDDLQRQHDQSIAAEAEARRKLEENQQLLQKELSESVANSNVIRDLNALKKQLALLESKTLQQEQETNFLKSRHAETAESYRSSAEILQTISGKVNQFDSRFRDISDQVISLKQLLNKEADGWSRMERENITRLQRDRNKLKDLETEIRRLEETVQQNINELKNKETAERIGNEEQWKSINDAIAAIKQRVDDEHIKMDQTLRAEIQSRLTHERGLLAKMSLAEEQLTSFINELLKSIACIQAGKQNVKVPKLEIDKVFQKIQSVIAANNKMGVDKLIKVEKKLSEMQAAFGRSYNELRHKITGLEGKDAEKVKKEMQQLSELKTKMNDIQDQIREKVQQQIPEIQKSEFEQYKIAVQKLAESLTVTKKAIEQKINEEMKQREKKHAEADCSFE